MMKVIVFLVQHHRKNKKNKDLAYIQTSLEILTPFLLVLVMIEHHFFGKIFFIVNDKIESYIRFIIGGMLPYMITFYFIFPPKKIIKNYRKYTYPKNYIWYLKGVFIASFIVFVLSAIYNNK